MMKPNQLVRMLAQIETRWIRHRTKSNFQQMHLTDLVVRHCFHLTYCLHRHAEPAMEMAIHLSDFHCKQAVENDDDVP